LLRLINIYIFQPKQLVIVTRNFY